MLWAIKGGKTGRGSSGSCLAVVPAVNDGGWDPGGHGGDGEKWVDGEHVLGVESIGLANGLKGIEWRD